MVTCVSALPTSGGSGVALAPARAPWRPSWPACPAWISTTVTELRAITWPECARMSSRGLPHCSPCPPGNAGWGEHLSSSLPRCRPCTVSHSPSFSTISSTVPATGRCWSMISALFLAKSPPCSAGAPGSVPAAISRIPRAGAAQPLCRSRPRSCHWGDADPEHVLAARLARDGLWDDEVRRQAHEHHLPIIEVDGTRGPSSWPSASGLTWKRVPDRATAPDSRHPGPPAIRLVNLPRSRS
jgi:hypothetical protein